MSSYLARALDTSAHDTGFEPDLPWAPASKMGDNRGADGLDSSGATTDAGDSRGVFNIPRPTGGLGANLDRRGGNGGSGGETEEGAEFDFGGTGGGASMEPLDCLRLKKALTGLAMLVDG